MYNLSVDILSLASFPGASEQCIKWWLKAQPTIFSTPIIIEKRIINEQRWIKIAWKIHKYMESKNTDLRL